MTKNKKDKKIKKMYIGLMMSLTLTFSTGGICTSAKEENHIKEIKSQDVQSNDNKNDETAAAYTEDSSYILNIGSVSKMYTVTAVMQLVDRGEVELDAPVTDYISDFKLADERYKDITVRMLMNHTSGLMGTLYGKGILFDDKSEGYHDEFLKILGKEKLKYEPGTFNCYCNDGFTLLEILVERVSGMTFTEYIEKNICEPLSLSDTGSVWNMDTERQAPVYVNGSIKTASENLMLIGAGGVKSNAEDVCNFGSAFFAGNDTLLSEEAKSEMAQNNKTGYAYENFGLGWDEVEKKDYKAAGVTVLSKGGDTIFQNGSLVVAPDEKISVAVVASGGGSGVDEEIALDLMDIALAEQGVNVEHQKEVKPELEDTVPESILSYEGLYADTHMIVSVTFPDSRYMQITSVIADNEFEEQYMYTKDGSFVKMSGDVASGNAIVLSPVETLMFEEKDGQIYICAPDTGCMVYKISEKNVDEKVQSAWDDRDDVSYYYISGQASDLSYMIENNCVTLHTSELAKGYVNGQIMIDENHAGYETIMPGSASRDISEMRIETVDGKEYLCMDALNYKYISEESIPVFSDDVSKVELKTDEASWFKIDGANEKTLRLDIPENASVYVFDQYGNLKYSSYMIGYGTSVPLPEYGMIVFVGESGNNVKIDR